MTLYPDIQEHTPKLAAVDYRQCTHERWKRAGIARNGNRGQMWMCVFCGKVRREQLIRDGRETRVLRLAPMFKSGWSARQAAKATGYHEHSVERIYRALRCLLGKQGACGCGRPASHRGTCRYRLQNSFSVEPSESPARRNGAGTLASPKGRL